MKYLIIIASSIAIILLVILSRKKRNKITYEEFTERLSGQIDNYMLKEEKEHNVTIVGGECQISISDDDKDTVIMNITIYGKDNNSEEDKWLKNEIVQKIKVSDFSDDEETQEKLKSLIFEPEIFKVTKPEKE